MDLAHLRDLATVFGVSLGSALVLTPLARRVALATDFVDAPGARKVHQSSTPYLGGAAIWLACMAALALRYEMMGHISAWALGGLLLFVLGLWDDRFGMQPRVKLSGQVLAAALCVAYGDSFKVFGFAAADAALTVFWIVGLSNAVNLLDNMDGLSAGTTGLSSLFLGLIAAAKGQYLIATLGLSVAGACLGFLRYNFLGGAASIFMGDAGSLFLGYTLAFAGVRLHFPGPHGVDLLVPVVILGLPLLDTSLVTAMRVRAGRPISLGGKDHCSHRLVALGYTQRQAVWLHYAAATAFGVLGAAMVWVGPGQGLTWLAFAALALGLAVGFFRYVAAVPVYPGDVLRGAPEATV